MIENIAKSSELDLLDMLGYGFDYDIDIDRNEPIALNINYSFVSEKGFRRSNNSDLSGKDISNIKNRNLDEVPKKYLKEITTKAINYCMDGKNLASREIFKSIKQ